jgi:DNA-binding transcriptional LysR family regulator
MRQNAVGFAKFSALSRGLDVSTLEDYTLAPVQVHAVYPAGTRAPIRVRRFVELLAQQLTKEPL